MPYCIAICNTICRIVRKFTDVFFLKGITTKYSINKKLKNGYTTYDWVKRQKCFPAFCMRTLSGENKITAEEIEFLKAKDCKIGLVIRGYAPLVLQYYYL